MEAAFLYLLQVIACSGLLYGYYHLFLRNNRFHQYNRFYLLAIIIVSTLLPFSSIPIEVQQTENIIYQSVEAFQSNVVVLVSGIHENSPFISLITILNAFYVLLAIIFLIRIVFSVISIYRLKKQSAFENVADIVFIQTAHPDAPFSFFRWLFWHNKIKIDSESGQQILRHEMYHINKKHTWDLLFIEVVTGLFWFNPFFYMIRRELKAIHEFLADDYATGGGNTGGYAELLLTRALDTNNLQLINPFFHNQLKRRIAMLTKSKKPAYQYLRKLMVLPLAAIAVLLFAFTYNKEIKNVRKSLEEKITTFENVKIPIDLTETDKVPTLKDTIKPLQNGLNITLGDTLLIIDGKQFITNQNEALKKIKTEDIQSVSVINSETATKQYGEKGKHGAIIISTEKTDKPITSGGVMRLKEVVVVGYGKSVNKNTGEVKNLKVAPLSFDKGDEVFTEAEMPANYPSGESAWRDLLERNLRGETPINNGLKPGNYTTQIQLVVEKDGTVTNVKPLTNLGFGMEAEAVRVIKLSHLWTPAFQNNREVRSVYIQPVTFQVLDDDGTSSTKFEPEPEIFTKVEQDPSYPGGDIAWKNFLERNLKGEVPVENRAARGKYTTIIQFIVDKDGNVSDVKPLTKLGYGMEEEAMRVIKKSGKWKPAMQNGRIVKSYIKKPVSFQVLEQ